MARRVRAPPCQRAKASWQVVSRPDAAADYRRALGQAEEACQRFPDNGEFLTTLGVALYRTGRYEDALARLTRSEQMNAVRSGSSAPADLAFLAMTEHQLGHAEKARALLGRLRDALKQGPHARDEDGPTFLEEAEALIRGPGRAPR